MASFRFVKLLAMICVVFLTEIASFSASATPARQFILTPQERAYLESLQARPVVISYSYDLVRAEFNGLPLGMLEPLLDVLKNEFGLNVNLIKLNWHDAFVQVENGTVDFYGPIAISEARRQQYVTVDPFYRSHSKIVTRVDAPMHSMLGLYNKSIGLLERSVITRTTQAYLGPNGKIVYFSTMDDMLEGLRTGLIDAFATVDNAEFEIFQYEDLQMEFSIENSYVDQGLISGNEEMLVLAELLTRYLHENPQVADRILGLRREALLRHAQTRFSNEIAYVRENYDEIIIYSAPSLYPLSYMENGVMKGMQLEINGMFEELTGVKVRFVTDTDYQDGIATVIEKIKAGECMAFVGGYYAIDIWNDPDIQYSPLLWLDTLRGYSYRNTIDDLHGKILGTVHLINDYLGWNNTTGNLPVLYNSHSKMLNALKNRDIDAVFMGEMVFNYNHSILKDYSLREIAGITAQAPMHLLYGAQNREFNAIFNQALKLHHIINPHSMGQWSSFSDKYKNDFIRMRHIQQTWATAAILVFLVMSMALIYLLRRVKSSLSDAKKRNHDLEQAHEIIYSSIDYSSKIQSNLLPGDQSFKTAFCDYSIIWKPRDIVGGDIYWIKNFDEGAVLCVCDCTGHGVPGALLTMLVVSTFEATVTADNYKDTAGVIWELEKRLITVLNVDTLNKEERGLTINDGCDLAVLYVAKDGSVTISAGNIHVFVCDGGKVTRIKGQRIRIGDGALKNKDAIRVVSVPANPDNKFYIASDGLYEQVGGKEKIPFGYDMLEKIILENHGEKQSVISAKIWQAFEDYRLDNAMRDDFELITFKPRILGT